MDLSTLFNYLRLAEFLCELEIIQLRSLAKEYQYMNRTDVKPSDEPISRTIQKEIITIYNKWRKARAELSESKSLEMDESVYNNYKLIISLTNDKLHSSLDLQSSLKKLKQTYDLLQQGARLSKEIYLIQLLTNTIQRSRIIKNEFTRDYYNLVVDCFILTVIGNPSIMTYYIQGKNNSHESYNNVFEELCNSIFSFQNYHTSGWCNNLDCFNSAFRILYYTFHMWYIFAINGFDSEVIVKELDSETVGDITDELETITDEFELQVEYHKLIIRKISRHHYLEYVDVEQIPAELIPYTQLIKYCQGLILNLLMMYCNGASEDYLNTKFIISKMVKNKRMDLIMKILPDLAQHLNIDPYKDFDLGSKSISEISSNSLADVNPCVPGQWSDGVANLNPCAQDQRSDGVANPNKGFDLRSKSLVNPCAPGVVLINSFNSIIDCFCAGKVERGLFKILFSNTWFRKTLVKNYPYIFWDLLRRRESTLIKFLWFKEREYFMSLRDENGNDVCQAVRKMKGCTHNIIYFLDCQKSELLSGSRNSQVLGRSKKSKTLRSEKSGTTRKDKYLKCKELDHDRRDGDKV